MKRPSWILPVALVSCILGASVIFPTHANALEWATVGPRALAMGGAGVAVITDAQATYWNPAGLALEETVDVRVQGTVQGVDRGGVLGLLSDIDDIDTGNISQENIDRLQALLDALGTEGTSLDAILNAGLYAKGSLGNHAFGVNIQDIFTSGLSLPVPLTASMSGGEIVVNGVLELAGAELRQIGLSYAYPFLNRTLSIGTSVNILQGVTYLSSAAVFGEGDNLIEVRTDLGEGTSTMTFGVDAGAIYQPTSWIRFALVGKYLNAPEFDRANDRAVEIDPQVRGGIAVFPYSSLTITADGDVTSNDNVLIPAIKSRQVAVGLEQTLFSQILALRGGAFMNVADAKTIVSPTAGLGLKIKAFTMNLGARYDFRFQAAGASLDLGLTF